MSQPFTAYALEEGSFQGQGDVRLYYRGFMPPQSKLDETLIFCHGQGEHTGRYGEFPLALQDTGLALYGHDLRGHGQSGGREVYVETFQNYLDDLSAFVAFLKKEGKIKGRFILYGNSLGGLIATHWAIQNPSQIRGLILSAPCFGLNLHPFLKGMNRFFNTFMPGFVYRNPIYPPYLTHDPEEIEKYRQDPWIKRRISVRLLEEMFKAMRALQIMPSWQVSFPVFFLVAGLERVVDREQSKNFYAKTQAPLKDFIDFAAFYHEIFHEKNRGDAFRVLKGCIDKISKTR